MSTTHEDFSLCVTRYMKKSNVKFHSIFIDNGGWINISDKIITKKSQDVMIRHVFDSDILTDNCIFAVITSVLRRTTKNSEEYVQESCMYIQNYASSKNYKMINQVVIPYGKRSFFISMHLMK